MIRKILTISGIAILLTVSLLYAQGGPGSGKRGARNYNSATEVTVKGTIEDVTQTTGKRGWSGTHLTLKSDQGTFDVHVGPSSYISSQKFVFAKGDTVEVTGSKTQVNGAEVLLARQITKDGKMLTLRNEQGFPLWSRRASTPK